MARVRPSLLAISGLLALGTAPAFAGPNGPTVVGGSATISGAGTASVTVTQSSPSAIINWNTFNVGAGEITRFNQPNASSVVLNRVTGGQGASEIYGTISANGRVFLINRDGILFGPGSKVDTAGFLATTHDINNDDFMAGRYVFGIPGRPDASIVNQGTITAHSYGFAALVAPGVRNTGTITANLGTVALVSGTGFTLDFYGDRLITLSVGDQIAAQVRDVATGLPLSSLVSNTGKLKANGGRVELTAATARQVVDSVINNTGVIEANTFRRHGGTIVLSAGTGATKVAGAPKQTIKLSGTLSASAKKKGKGGKIIVTAENIEVSGATINATGPAGGGTVLIGGDWSGGHPNTSLVSNGSAHLEPYAVPTAATVTVDGASTINASATGNGNGGKVIVWADQLNTFAGTILARGGPNGGDGGFVETSGHQQLNFTGSVDTRAPNGAMGTLLLDPADYYIVATAGGSPTGASEITASLLASQLASGNVVIATNNAVSPVGQNGDIFVNAPVVWSASTTLTLEAFRNIRMAELIGFGTPPNNANIRNTGGGSLILHANSTGNFAVGSGNGIIDMPNSTFSNRVDWSASTGTVTVFYNPTSYTSPTNFTTPPASGRFILASSSQLTAYMLVNSDRELQDVNTNLHGTYALGRDITSFTNVPNFAPIGAVSSPFLGVFEGLGHTISNITIAPTLATTNNIGLFAYIGTGSVVRNFNINGSVTANKNVPSSQFVGILAGENAGTITNISVSGTINGGTLAGVIAGGLVGQNQPSGIITQSQSAANVTLGNAGSGSGQGNDAGGLVGNNEGAISNSSATGTIVGGASVFAGGLVGRNENFSGSGPVASITNSNASGNVSVASGTVFSSSAGGLVGFNAAKGSISNSSATGNVSGGAFAILGGLVGQNEGLITLSTYSVGTVNGTGSGSGFADTIGGLVGFNSGTVRDSSVAAGVTVTGSAVTAGGLAGENSGTIVGTTAGQVFSNATVTVSGVDSMAGGFVGQNWAGASITNARATGNVSGAASYAGGFAGENDGSITTSTATGSVGTTFNGGLAGGFVGTNSGAITGSTASGNVTASTDGAIGGFVGGNDGTITQSSATGTVNGTGSFAAGGFAGLNGPDGTISNSSATGPVSGGVTGGGVAGFVALNAGTITDSMATGAVSGFGSVGGFVGLNIGMIDPSSATGSVAGGVGSIVGGFAGSNLGVITLSTASGNVSGGQGSVVGGFVGFNIGDAGSGGALGAISHSHASGNVTGGDGSLVGGFFGINIFGAIDHAFAVGAVNGGTASTVGGFGALNMGTVSVAFSNGAATGGDGSYVGGFVGVNYSVVDFVPGLTTGAISQSYAVSSATGGNNSFVGGFAAINVGSLNQTLAVGKVTGGAGSTTGGLVASNNTNYILPSSVGSYLDPPGTATNSYYDTQSTGQSTSAGGTGQTTSQLSSGLPAGFDPAAWTINAGQTYPYLIDPAPNPFPVIGPSSPAPTPTPTPTPPIVTPTPTPTPPPPFQFVFPTDTPLYPIQQIADYWRDATPAAIPAALVTPPAPLQAVSRRQSAPNNNNTPNAPRESGVPPPGETRFIQDQVVFRICGVPESRVQTIARGIGLVSIGAQSLGLVGCTIYQYRITDGQTVRDKIRRLERLRIVASAQPNYVFALAQVPPVPAATPPASEGDPAQYLVAKLRLPEVHRLARGNNVRVAVIDSEIDVNHPDLEGVIAERFDATGATEKPHPHGTGMAGAIASHKRLIGIAPGVRLLAVHAFGAASTGGQGTTMQIVKGLDWAVKQNARIVNMSFAGPKDPLLTQAVKATHDKGIVLIAAAGNAGPDSPPLYPGADPNVIAVTATDEDDHSYTGANRGKYVAVAAPGVDVLVPAPDGSYQLTTGTSVAAAEVSGVAALLLEKDPKLTPDEIRSILTSTAKTLGTAKRDDEFGYGLVDPYKALTSVNPRASSLEPAPAPAPIAAAAR